MVDLMTEPVGLGKRGKPTCSWATSGRAATRSHKLLKSAMNPKAFRDNYASVAANPGKLWSAIKGSTGQVYGWPQSTYIAQPPFFQGFTEPAPETATSAARASWRCSATRSPPTTSRRPARSRRPRPPASTCSASGVHKADFNSYGSRRGHHEVMMRGTFANVRIKNLMLPALPDGSREEGG
jgi:aconitate hydratase